MIFLTGATGYVGQNILPQILKTNPDEKISALARTKPSFEIEGVEWVVGDLRNNSTYASYVARAHTIIHLAGCISPSKLEDFQRINVSGTNSLLSVARKQGCPRIIYLSSYDVVCNGESFYGKSKKLAEQEIVESNLRFTIVRPTVVFGGTGRSGFHPLLRMIRRGHFVVVVGAGRQLLQPLHVVDLGKLLVDILNREEQYSGKTLNIGGPEKLDWIELVKYLGRKESVSPIIIRSPSSVILTILNLFSSIDTLRILAEKIKSLSTDKVVRSDTSPLTQDCVRLSEWCETSSN